MSDTPNGTEHIFSSAAESILAEGQSSSSESAPRPEREGLPRSYRMRADRHYVEQIASRAAGQPVRMIPVGEIDSSESSRQTDLRALLESIRVHGVVHPLMIRRAGARYAIVAGRKRLAAAQILRLGSVPCLVQDVDDAQATALAVADNLTATPVVLHTERSEAALAVKQLIANHLATVRSCTDLVSAGPTSPIANLGMAPAAVGTLGMMSRPFFDLIRANAWRASRLADVLDLITNAPPSPVGDSREGRAWQDPRDRRLSSILDEIVNGFAAEGHLSGFALEAHTIDDISSSGVNPHEVLAGAAAAVMATLPLVAHASPRVDVPTVVIKSSAAGPASIVIDVSQSLTAVSAGFIRRFFDDEGAGTREGGWAAAASALAVKALADRYDGRAAFEAGPNGGSTLRLVLVRRS